MSPHDRPSDRLPETGAGFVWDLETVPVLRPATRSARAAYTTRVGGTSSGPFASLNLTYVGGDEREAVRQNRGIAGATVGADERWSVTRQVHGADVTRADPSALRDSDALWTDDPQDTVAVLSADCVLVLLCSPGRVGVAHAGWRGLASGVVENAVAATGATDAFAGPAIGPCCYEVGPEVVEPFARRYPRAVVDERHVDLWVAAEDAARSAGAAAFHAARICTSCHPDLFFSHRRDRGATGRQALVARLDG